MRWSLVALVLSGCASTPAVHEPHLSKVPATVTAGPFTAHGCIAWSADELRALCVTGGGSTLQGGQAELGFVPDQPAGFTPVVLRAWKADEGFADQPMVLTAADAAAINTRLAEGHYVQLDPEVSWLRPLVPNQTLTWALPQPGVSVAWSRDEEQTVEGENRWSTYDDELAVSCGEVSDSAGHSGHHDPSPTVRAGVVPGEQALLVVWADGWAIEGELGEDWSASVVELGECVPRPPMSLR